MMRKFHVAWSHAAGAGVLAECRLHEGCPAGRHLIELDDEDILRLSNLLRKGELSIEDKTAYSLVDGSTICEACGKLYCKHSKCDKWDDKAHKQLCLRILCNGQVVELL